MRNLEARQREMRERHAANLPNSNNPPAVPLPAPVPKQVKQVNAPSTEPEPTDPEYIRIREVESRIVVASPNVTQHKLVTATGRYLAARRLDGNGLLQAWPRHGTLSVRVAKESVDRALRILNAIIQALGAEGLIVTVKDEKYGTGVDIFGQRVEFELVEKLREKSRREVKETATWTRRIVEYEPTGQLEFRVREKWYGFRKGCRDSKTQPLEIQISRCLGLLMREARERQIWTEKQKQREIEEQKKRREMAELASRIWEEEKKLQEFEGWVSAWAEAQKMRDFIAALERIWTQQGHDLTPGTPKEERLAWMRQQADRQDPMVPSPPSILDRKHETSL